jgi:hypothetical protein
VTNFLGHGNADVYASVLTFASDSFSSPDVSRTGGGLPTTEMKIVTGCIVVVLLRKMSSGKAVIGLLVVFQSEVVWSGECRKRA